MVKKSVEEDLKDVQQVNSELLDIDEKFKEIKKEISKLKAKKRGVSKRINNKFKHLIVELFFQQNVIDKDIDTSKVVPEAMETEVFYDRVYFKFNRVGFHTFRTITIECPLQDINSNNLSKKAYKIEFHEFKSNLYYKFYNLIVLDDSENFFNEC